MAETLGLAMDLVLKQIPGVSFSDDSDYLSPSPFFVQNTPKLSFRAGLGIGHNAVGSLRYGKTSFNIVERF